MKTKITLTYQIGPYLRVDIEECLSLVFQKYPHFLNLQIDCQNDTVSFIMDTDQLPDLDEFQELSMDRPGHWWCSFSDLYHIMTYLEKFPYDIYDLSYNAKKIHDHRGRDPSDPGDLKFEISQIEILKDSETKDS